MSQVNLSLWLFCSAVFCHAAMFWGFLAQDNFSVEPKVSQTMQ